MQLVIKQLTRDHFGQWLELSYIHPEKCTTINHSEPPTLSGGYLCNPAFFSCPWHFCYSAGVRLKYHGASGAKPWNRNTYNRNHDCEHRLLDGKTIKEKMKISHLVDEKLRPLLSSLAISFSLNRNGYILRGFHPISLEQTLGISFLTEVILAFRKERKVGSN